MSEATEAKKKKERTIERKIYLNDVEDAFLQKWPAGSHSTVVRMALRHFQKYVKQNPDLFPQKRLMRAPNGEE